MSHLDFESILFTEADDCELCDDNAVSSLHLKSHMHRKHVRLQSYNCENCESENKSEFDMKSHMHRKHVRLRLDKEHYVYDFQCVQVSWLLPWSDVDSSSIEVRLTKIVLYLKINDDFLTKFEFRRLMNLLFSSVSGNLEECLCGWSCPFSWDPGVGFSDRDVALPFSLLQPRNISKHNSLIRNIYCDMLIFLV